jgi:hypothetical protein
MLMIFSAVCALMAVAFRVDAACSTITADERINASVRASMK